MPLPPIPIDHPPGLASGALLCLVAGWLLIAAFALYLFIDERRRR